MGAAAAAPPAASLEILDEETGKQTFFNLGPHPPRLWPEDIELLHKPLAGTFTTRGRDTSCTTAM